MNTLLRIAAALTLLALAACASGGNTPSTGFTASSVAPAAPAAPTEDYRIGPLDKLSINVYQMKDLTLTDVQVDGGGRLVLPLIGSVSASGKTALELSDEIANMLRGRYLQSPQVAVWVTDAVSQKVTVDGSVIQPGVYTMSGPSTLMEVVAMAKGPDMKYANLSRVVVFRTINGQRSAAVFNLKRIRQGKDPDPEIRGADIVVVDGSQLKSAWRETVTALPGIAIFRPLF